MVLMTFSVNWDFSESLGFLVSVVSNIIINPYSSMKHNLCPKCGYSDMNLSAMPCLGNLIQMQISSQTLSRAQTLIIRK